MYQGCSLFTGKILCENPLCECDDFETASHNLLHVPCPFYDYQRQHSMLNLHCPFTVNNLLIGDEHLTLEQNRQFCLKVQRYNSSTKPFSMYMQPFSHKHGCSRLPFQKLTSPTIKFLCLERNKYKRLCHLFSIPFVSCQLGSLSSIS